MTETSPVLASSLPDTEAVAEFMRAFDQTVRTTPTADISEDERLLRARLVLEEAIEFVTALGCGVVAGGSGEPLSLVDDVRAVRLQDRRVDLVEATDALADLVVVVKGSALTLGVPLDAAVDVVHETNMAKMGPDGRPIRRGDGKVIKPAGWQPPTEGLRALLREHGWNGPAATTTG